jgi:hypothetical protein
MVAIAEAPIVLRAPEELTAGPPISIPIGTTPLATPLQATAPEVRSGPENSFCSRVVDAAGYGA